MTALLRHLPNTLTALRLVAAPVLALLLARGLYAAAFVLFVLAGASDAVDGYLAKRFASRSRFGAYLDPAADKLLMLAAFLMLTEIGVTHWWLTLIVVGRDIAIVAGILLALALALPIAIAPLAIGKASTVVQVSFVGLMLLLLTLHFNSLPVQSAARAAEAIVALVTILSWLAYGQVLLRAFSLRRRPA